MIGIYIYTYSFFLCDIIWVNFSNSSFQLDSLFLFKYVQCIDFSSIEYLISMTILFLSQIFN
jgi:hypothetical protein